MVPCLQHIHPTSISFLSTSCLFPFVFHHVFSTQAQGIPGSFKDVFVETRNVLALRRKRSVPGVRLSRREELLIDTNSNSLSYLAAFFVAQAVPILGWFPLAIAWRFPRQLLTSHFHSVEQMNDFLKEEYKERTENSLELRDHIVRTCAPIHPRLFLAGGPLESMSSLSSKHVKLLAGATSLHHGNIMNQVHPPLPNLLLTTDPKIG